MKSFTFHIPALAAILGLLSSCGGKSETAVTAGISPQQMADGLHAVMESDRTVYTRAVVNRLQNEEKVIKASEHWQDDKALPLPAQMFRMGAEMVAEKKKGFTYALLSEWPINKQNSPKTDAEKTGLAHIVKNVGQNYYTEETLGGKKYFTAVYPDIAIAAACVKCHNNHDDSPRTDFKEGDVMGGVVIRIPLTVSN
ncbi:uncharacterized protein DUF3365 [Prosthecobacter fusiformis]|uniref:Uncharacterized protein DUF3365 n=1 Tax=Prosthecobacter fusiformis TaxID=48464 RepID=A0A4R7S6U2_9BACT|nr:DUF3365 domain-containing protein [Prosthecobacter fusiformis]TDU73436.1 uncharacterized protein DUF3365 [Prosthecobacter fusiformis]